MAAPSQSRHARALTCIRSKPHWREQGGRIDFDHGVREGHGPRVRALHTQECTRCRATPSVRPFTTAILLPLVAGGALAADGGTPILDLRYRHETVDWDRFAHDAHADTLRVRAGYATPAWHGWSALAEADGVLGLGEGRYNDTRNGQRQYPVVADRAGAEVNQALLRYVAGKNSATLGRQRINPATSASSVEARGARTNRPTTRCACSWRRLDQ